MIKISAYIWTIWSKRIKTALLFLNIALLATLSPAHVHASPQASGAKLIVRTVNKTPFTLWRKGESNFASISTLDITLSNRAIRKLLAQSKELGGTNKVGSTLSELDLPSALREEVLEDTYLRLLIVQEHLPRSEAEELFVNLGNVPGFRANLRKISGNNPLVSAGHLNELRLANAMTKNGFKVRGVAEPFNDPLKRGITDIDLILERDNKVLIFEAKDYASNTRLPMDSFRADMDSLLQYQLAHPNQQVIPIFSLTNIPQNSLDLKNIVVQTTQKKIQLLTGSADEVTIQILQLIKSISL